MNYGKFLEHFSTKHLWVNDSAVDEKGFFEIDSSKMRIKVEMSRKLILTFEFSCFDTPYYNLGKNI